MAKIIVISAILLVIIIAALWIWSLLRAKPHEQPIVSDQEWIAHNVITGGDAAAARAGLTGRGFKCVDATVLLAEPNLAERDVHSTLICSKEYEQFLASTELRVVLQVDGAQNLVDSKTHVLKHTL